MLRKNWLLIFGIVTFILNFSVHFEQTAAQTASNNQMDKAAIFYKGRTISLITGWSPGGGYDMQLRLTAPYLKEYTESTVIVRNMPGASGLKAINYLAKAAKPDGLNIALLKLGVLLPAQLLTPDEIKYDLTKMNAIAGTRAYYGFFAIRNDLPYKSIKELIASGREIRVAATDRRSELNWATAMVLKPVGMNLTPVLGYASSGELLLAVQRGEADANFLPYNNVGPYIKEGKLRALCIFSSRRNNNLPDVPTIYEALTLPKDVKYWADFYAGLNTFAGCILAPPGVPKERVEFLRSVFQKLMVNKELIRKLESADLDPLYTPGKEMEEFIKYTLSMESDKLKQWKKIIGIE